MSPQLAPSGQVETLDRVRHRAGAYAPLDCDPLIVSMRMPVITVTLPGGAQGDLSRKQAEWLSCYLDNAVDWLTNGEDVSGEDISGEDG
jgi:hypothetical protein